jgi:hypothetical protein
MPYSLSQGLKLNGGHKLPADADKFNLLGENINTTKTQKVLLVLSK